MSIVAHAIAHEGASSRDQVEGTCFVVGAACVFAMVAVVVKRDPLPVLLATECRFLVSWVVAIAFMLAYRVSRGLRWFGPEQLRKWLLLKCAMSFIFITLWWTALRHAPLGDCIAIIYTSPVFTSLLSRIVLKESLPKVFPFQVALVSLGTVLVLDPPFIRTFGTSGGDAPPDRDYTFVFLALGACAIVPIVTRKAKDCSWIEVEHVSACLASAVLTPALLIAQRFLGSAVTSEGAVSITASPGEVAMIVVAAGGSFVGIAMETKGYQMAEVGKASMFRYVEVPFAYILQQLGTGDAVQVHAILGSVLIVSSCFLGLMSPKRHEPSVRQSSISQSLLGT